MRFILRITIFIVTFTAPQITYAQYNKIFSLYFEWGDIPHCDTGEPYIVSNPKFSFKHIPQGTFYIYFKLVDMDTPQYDHGSAWVKYQRTNIIPSGVFTYKRPCTPDGAHSYQWVAIANDDKNLTNGNLAMT